MKPEQLRRHLIGSICLATTVVILLSSLAYKHAPSGGETVADWFNELPPTHVVTAQLATTDYGKVRMRPRETVEAIQRIGTNALPFLLYKLSQRGLPFRQRLEAVASKCGIRRALFTDPEVERARAVTALLALTPLPESAMVRLLKLSSNTNNTIGRSATYVLKAQTNDSLKYVYKHWP